MGNLSDIALAVVKVFAGIYVGLCVLLFLLQKSQIYVPAREVNSDPSAADLKFEGLRLPVAGGATVSAWYIPASVETKATVLFCHGNGGNIGDRVGTIDLFHGMGFNVMIFDYQGYGKSTGTTTEKGTYDDSMAAWNYLIEKKDLAPQDISIFGRSLGGAVAIELAENVKPKCLAVESTFSSAPDMAERMFPFLPARLLCRYKYSSTDRIKNIHCPVIIAHGRADRTIPYDCGRTLFEAANEPKQFFELEGGHNAGGIDITPEYQRAFAEAGRAGL